MPQHLPLQVGNWAPLNELLAVSHNPDGTLIDSARFTNNRWPTPTVFSAQCCGIDATNGQMLFTTSAGGGSGQLLSSSDFGTTMSADRIPPASNWNDRKKIVYFKGKLYLLVMVGSVMTVWETTPNYAGGATWSWTQRFTAVAGANDALSTNLSTDGAFLYLGEYGDPAGGPQIYRSADGTTWTSVLGPLSGNRHCHAVEPDPYNAGHVWATFGDGGNKYVMRSTDSGVTWATIIDGVSFGTWAQAVQISFSTNYVWFVSDDISGTVYCIDRSELKVRLATANHITDVPVPAAIPRPAGSSYADGVFTNTSTTVTSATASFVTGDLGRRIVSSKLPGGEVTIASVTNGTTVVLSKAATSSGTTGFYLGGSRWPGVPLFGAVDPSTEIMYVNGVDTSNPSVTDEPIRAALFVLPAFGSALQLFQTIPPTNGASRWMVFVYGGFVFYSRWRLPLLSRA